MNLAPSNSIIAFIEVHFNPGKVTPKVFLKIVYSKRSELCPIIMFYVHMLFVSFQWPTHYYQIIERRGAKFISLRATVLQSLVPTLL